MSATATASPHVADFASDSAVVVTDDGPAGFTVHRLGCSRAKGGTETTWSEAGWHWIDKCIDVLPDRVPRARHTEPEPVVDTATSGVYGEDMMNTATATLTPAARWIKVGDTFAISAPGHTTGDTVTVTTKAGKSSDVTLGEQLKPGVFTKAETPAAEGEWKFRRQGDEWVAVGNPTRHPAEGGVIQITRKDGSLAAAIVTEVIVADEAGWVVGIRQAETTPAATATTEATVPAGRYAIPSTGDNDLAFYLVDRPTEGRWAGRVFISLIIGGREAQRVQGSAIPGILRRIEQAGIVESTALYGQEIGRCGMCNRTLTDETSRARGIGPDCARRMGA